MLMAVYLDKLLRKGHERGDAEYLVDSLAVGDAGILRGTPITSHKINISKDFYMVQQVWQWVPRDVCLGML